VERADGGVDDVAGVPRRRADVARDVVEPVRRFALFGWREADRFDNVGGGVCTLTQDPGYIVYSALGSFYVPLVTGCSPILS